MAHDIIRIVNMQFFGRHGVDPNERSLGGRFSFDVEMALDLAPAGQSDDLTQTVDYGAVYSLIARLQGEREFLLLESLAQTIALAILDEFPPVDEVTVRARKHSVPLAGLIDYAEVQITRTRAASGVRSFPPPPMA